MLIRPYRKSDLEACYALDQVCFPVDIAYSRSELRHFLTRRNAYALIAEQAGHEGVSGFLVADEDRPASWGTSVQKDRAHIVTLDVAPDVRRSGVAAALMAEAEQHYRGQGFLAIALEVAVDNEAALSFYRKHAFISGERLPGYYNGRIDAVSMQKLLWTA